jgi:hypothetical protein
MRTRAIKPGDIVLVNKRGRIFHAKIRGLAAGGGFDVSPVERGISYLTCKPAEITEHWSLARVRREDRPPPGQISFDDLETS